MKAMSNFSCANLGLRHCTQGSLAKVVMPENMESAVTLGSDKTPMFQKEKIVDTFAIPR